MRKTIFILLFTIALCAVTNAQTVEISVSDLKQLRLAAIDAAYQKARADEAEKQANDWKTQSVSWRELYEKEKYRSDVVQENRVKELSAAVDGLKAANFQLHEQAKADRVKLGELEFDVRKYKSQRKWFAVTGFITGAAAGGFVGNRINF